MTRGICELCGGFFSPEHDGNKFCKSCDEKMDTYFQRIRSYLETHRNATIGDVSIDTKVSLKMIDKLLKEGRIQVVEDGVSVKEKEEEWVFNRNKY